MIYAAGQPITHAATASTSGLPYAPHTFAWAFDDGTQGSGASTTKTYATSGYHVSTVTATDQVTGGTASASKTITVVGGSVSSTSLNTGRAKHASILLNNGKVLITGGFANVVTSSPLASCEIYDPSSGTFTPTGPLNTARGLHKLVKLPNGNVMAVGGVTLSTNAGDWYYGNAGNLTSCEIYDVVSGTWSATGSTSFARVQHFLELLPDGTVITGGGIAVGGPTATVEIYNPATGIWSPGPSLPYNLGSTASVVLANGVLALFGGYVSTGLNSVGPKNGKGVLFLSGSTFINMADYPGYPNGVYQVPGKIDGYALQVGGNVVFVGGHEVSNSYYGTDIGVYSISGNTWSFNNSSPLISPDHTSDYAAGYAANSSVILSAGPWNLVNAYGVTYNTMLPNVAKQSGGATATYLGNGYVLVCGGGSAATSYQAGLTDAYLYLIGA